MAQSATVQNRWVFRDDWPVEIVHRDTELEQLSRRLRPALNGQEADDALIHGPSGVGKTASGRYMLRQLNQQRSIESATIECAGKTCHGVIYEAIDRHSSAAALTPNAPTQDLIRTLRSIVDEPYLLILDEADTIPGLDCLEDLLKIRGVSAVAITHDSDEWLSRLPGDLAERFRGEGEIAFGKYDDDELVDILEPRVDRGLVPGVAGQHSLEFIAAHSGGVARKAVLGLLSAAELADERDHDYIEESDLADCIPRAERMMRESNLRSLPPTYQAMYELVRRYGPGGVRTTELKREYLEHSEEIFEHSHREPVGWARARDYLGKISDYDLIRITGSTSARTYAATDAELEAPLEGVGREEVKTD